MLTTTIVSKHCFFLRQTHLNTDEHFVSSTFVIPEIGESYRRTYNSYPILYRVDISFDFGLGQSFGDFIPFSELEQIVHSHLTNKKALFQSNDVHHVSLFDVSLPDEPVPPSAPPFHQDHHGNGAFDGLEISRIDQAISRGFDTPTFQQLLTPSNRHQTNHQDGSTNPLGPKHPMRVLEFSLCMNRHMLCLTSQSKYRYIFAVRNPSTREIEFFPFFEPRSIPAFYPSAVSPQKMCVVQRQELPVCHHNWV